MSKKNKIILGLTGIVIIVGIIAFWPRQKKEEIKETQVSIPSRLVIESKSETGAQQISLSQEEYNRVYLIKDLRNKVPIEREYFSIDFDYKISKFIVRLKEEKKGKAAFQKWLEETGYKVISEEYFQTE